MTSARKAKTLTKRKAPVKVNKLFPGLPNYTGPQRGWFGFVHHGQLFERASCPIRERIEYVKARKPASEKPTRLRHIIYLGARLNTLIANYSPVAPQYLSAPRDPDIQAAVLAYAKKHIKPLRWSTRDRSLVHANRSPFTG